MYRSVFLLGVALLTSCSGDTALEKNAMRTVSYDHGIGVPVDAAWAVFADFAGFAEWNAMRITLEINGDGVGMTRTMDIPGIGRVSERLDQRDDANMTIAYSLVEGTPLGMVEYAAKVTLKGVGDERTLIQWRGEFDGAPGADLDQMAENLTGSYQGMSAALENFVSKR